MRMSTTNDSSVTPEAKIFENPRLIQQFELTKPKTTQNIARRGIRDTH